MMKAIRAWLCRHGFHEMHLHHQSGAYDYLECARCPKRTAVKIFEGYSVLDDYWLAGNDGEPPAPTPPTTGSGVQAPPRPAKQRRKKP